MFLQKHWLNVSTDVPPLEGVLVSTMPHVGSTQKLHPVDLMFENKKVTYIVLSFAVSYFLSFFFQYKLFNYKNTIKACLQRKVEVIKNWSHVFKFVCNCYNSCCSILAFLNFVQKLI